MTDAGAARILVNGQTLIITAATVAGDPDTDIAIYATAAHALAESSPLTVPYTFSSDKVFFVNTPGFVETTITDDTPTTLFDKVLLPFRHVFHNYQPGHESAGWEADPSFVTAITALTSRASALEGRADDLEALEVIVVSASVNLVSLAAGASADLDVTVTGAAVGQGVVVNPAALTAGLVVNARVKATNTVTVRAYNSSVGTIDEGSASWTFVLIPPPA